MRSHLVKIPVAAAVLALSAGAAQAAIITATYTVVGSNFTSTATPPYSSIIESFTVTFDNTSNVSQQTTGISLNPASTITPTSTLAFSHTYVPGLVDTLIVGGIASTVATSDPNSTDFAVTISGASNANFSISALSYSVGAGATYSATTRTVGTPPSPPTTVAEPASLLLLGTTAATLAFMRRKSKSNSVKL